MDGGRMGIRASGGSGFFLSRLAASIIIEKYESKEWHNYKDVDNNWLYVDDVLVAKLLMHNGTYLLHDNAYLFESPYKPTIGPLNEHSHLHVPFIGDETGKHLCVQHYLDGHMYEIMDALDLWEND
jgi:hypothetical protein